MLLDYLLTYYKEDLINIVQQEDDCRHFSINIKFDRMLQENPLIANKLLKEFGELSTECNLSAVEAQKIIVEELKEEYLIIKPNIHIRLYNFPSCPELVRIALPKNKDVGLFLELSGTVVRTTAVKLLEFQRHYQCAKCRSRITVKADFEEYYSITPPRTCPECNGSNFIAVCGLERSNSKDYQEVKIQEQLSQLTVGLLPNSLWIILEDDLVDSCKPGDNVTICGIVKRRWKIPTAGKKIEVAIVVLANHVFVNNDTSSVTIITPEMKQQFCSFWSKFKYDPLKGRDIIVNSFCPQVYGLHIVKLAVMVILAGGSQFHKFNDTGVKIRSQPHLLLVGDPGTGKSQILKFASNVVARSVLTTGVGSTSAGLTVTAINENGEWQLEAGALVLSDGGVCCIDEFNSMKEHDRTSIHEAMEQQSISVAKANIVCKLNTRCSILAATNPKGKLDLQQPLAVNIGLPSPLLSRFDIVLILKDNIDSDWDNLVADYILNGFNENQDTKSIWEIQTLQAYLLYIKKIQPNLTNNTNKILSTYYQFQRKAIYRNKARTTVRLLDSLVRLSQGHARLMCHSEVEVIDAVTAVVLVEASMQGDASILGLEFDIHCCSPENSMDSYTQLIRTVLTKLELFDLLEKELENITEKLNESVKEVDASVDHLSENFETVLKTKSNSTTKNITITKRKSFENFCESNKKYKLNIDDFENFNIEKENTSTQKTVGNTKEEEITKETDIFQGITSNELNNENYETTSIQTNSKKIDNDNETSNSNITVDNISKCNVLSQKSTFKHFLNEFRFKPKAHTEETSKSSEINLNTSVFEDEEDYNSLNLEI